MTIVQQQALWAAVIGILVTIPTLIMALVALLQARTNTTSIDKLNTTAAIHDKQLNGELGARIQKAVNAGPEQPSQAQRDLPTPLNIIERPHQP